MKFTMTRAVTKLLILCIALSPHFCRGSVKNGPVRKLDLGSINIKDSEYIFKLRPSFILKKFDEYMNKSVSFLFPLDWSETNGTHGFDDDSFMNQVVLHNKRYSLQWKLWFSLTLRGDASTELKSTIKFIKKINQKSNGTVTTLLLDYGLLTLSSNSLPLIQRDIQISSQIVASENLKFGVLIDTLNCLTSVKHIKNLGLQPGHIFVANDDATSYISGNKFFYHVVPCMRSFKNTGVLLGMKADFVMNRELDDDGETLTEKNTHAPTNKASTKVRRDTDGNAYETKLDYIIANRVGKQITSDFHRKFNPLKNEQEWLNDPMAFDKTYFGASVFPWDTFIYKQETILTSLLQQFRSIIIETSPVYGHNITDYVRKFAQAEMTSSNLHLASPEGVDGGASLTLGLVMNVYFEDFKSNKLVLDNIVSAAVAGKEENPGISTTVLIHWAVYLRANMPAKFVNLNESRLERFLKQAKALEPVLEYVQTLNKSQVRFGLIWELKEIERINEYENNSAGVEEFTRYINNHTLYVNHIVLKLTILRSDVTLDKLLYNSRTIMYMLSGYINVLRDPTTPTLGTLSIWVYIGINWCEGRSYVNTSEVTEVVLFWEKMQNWAVSQKVVLIMNTAFETKQDRDCKQKRFLFERPSCLCGWWQVSQDIERVTSEENGRMVSIEDRKSIARRLYAEEKAPKIEFNTKTEPSKAQSFLFVALLTSGCILFCIFMVAISIYVVNHYKSKDIISKQEVHNFLFGSKQVSAIGTENASNTDAQGARYNKELYEVTPSSFSIDLNNLIGEGEFATVYKGLLKRGEENREMAVKMKSGRLSGSNQQHGNNLAIRGLISEIKILSYIGHHPNIIKLEAAYTAKIRKGRALVFLELCQIGSLDKYLHSCTPSQSSEVCTANNFLVVPNTNLDNDNTHDEEDKCSNLSAELGNDFIKWSKEIACGMKFLAEKKVVHADLATRNVLLDSTKTAKISDFGLSRRLYNYSEYAKKESASLPWRWMAPESLRKLFFNEKSDVWAFGVTLWEIYTLGDLPYPGLSYDVNFPQLLIGGVRLPKPKYSSSTMYDTMKRCWATNPAERPGFSELNTLLSTLK